MRGTTPIQEQPLLHDHPRSSTRCWTGRVFWDGLEWLLARTIGLVRREDTSVRDTGPARVVE